MSLLDMMVARWSVPDTRPLFRGRLIDADGCCCAQGDVLRMCGWSDDQLRSADQFTADREAARALGISLAHSILLRHINDRCDGCPQDVLAHPELILGDQAPRILTFWRFLDKMTKAQWAATRIATRAATRDAAAAEAGDTAWAAARAATWDIAWDAVWDATRDIAWDTARAAAKDTTWAAGWAAAWATNEIQGAVKLQTFFFLPLFGINHPDELDREPK